MDMERLEQKKSERTLAELQEKLIYTAQHKFRKYNSEGRLDNKEKGIEDFMGVLIKIQNETGFDDNKMMNKLLKCCNEYKEHINAGSKLSLGVKSCGSKNNINMTEISNLIVGSSAEDNIVLFNIVDKMINRGKEIPAILKKKGSQISNPIQPNSESEVPSAAPERVMVSLTRGHDMQNAI